MENLKFCYLTLFANKMSLLHVDKFTVDSFNCCGYFAAALVTAGRHLYSCKNVM